MDVLKPELIWVGGRCYRFFESGVWSNACNIAPYVEDNEQPVYEEEDEICDANIEIVPFGATKFKHTFHVAKPFFPFIIGSKNAVRKRLETETQTIIQIPKIGQDGDIVITGSTHQNITSARRRLNLLIEASKKKLKPTHFLSIPVNEGHIIMKINEFKNDILNNTQKPARGVDNTIFQIPSKLHLTIGMLILLDDVERKQAADALDHCKEYIVKPILEKYGQIKIRLQGVEVMNDDPAEVSVLYANVVDADNGLQELVDKIADYYNDIGLLKFEKKSVKLHVTLMNRKFRDDYDQTMYKATETFDATEILKDHQDTFFGEVVLKQIHVSQLHTISSNGYYQATAKISLLEI